MILALVAAVAFLVALALDFALARYNLALRDHKPREAGLWSMAVACLSAAGVLALVEVSPLMLIPQCAGYYVGTVLAHRSVEIDR